MTESNARLFDRLLIVQCALNGALALGVAFIAAVLALHGM